MELERRNLFQGAMASIETRDDGSEKIVGHAAVFFDKSNRAGTEFDLWGDGQFLERISRSAFDRAIQEKHDVRGLVNHDPALLLGRTTSGTLKIEVDKIGLRYEIDPPDTQVGRDTAVSLRRGDMSGSSFAFMVHKESFTEGDEGVTIREIEDLELFDVGPVTFPAYTGADSDIAKRSLDSWKKGLPKPKLEFYRRKLKLLELGLTE